MRKLMALVTVISLVLIAVPGLIAGFSDTETSLGNYVELGDLNLKVAIADSNWEGSDFRDDKPWGAGLISAFDVPEAESGQTYVTNYLLWNCGNVPGTAYLRLRIDSDAERAASSSTLTVWYDDNGNRLVDGGETVSGTLESLSYYLMEMGPLPECEIRRLQLELRPLLVNESGDPVWMPFSLDFRTEFQLIQTGCPGFSDTETSLSYIAGAGELGGTPGFWRSPAAINAYGKPVVVGWFSNIVVSSQWFDGIILTGNTDVDYIIMCDILKEPEGGGYDSMVNKFRSQYLATRLNTMPAPPRLNMTTSHPLDSISGAATCFGYISGTLSEIITTIESKEADGDIFSPLPDEADMETMKDVCDALNNTDI